jgi:peptidoglycan/LPS O-acetylase OafA/YrhL
MTPRSSVGRTTLAFSIGSAGLAIAFVAVMASAVMLSSSPHDGPAASDYRWAATALLLLIAGFFAALLAARRAALPIPPARIGVFAGLVGVSLLLVAMMLVGKPLGMRGPVIVAVFAGIASAAGAVGLARMNRPTEA